MPGFEDIEKLADDHDDQLDKALDKVGYSAGGKLVQDEQVDDALEAAKEHTGSGDTTD